jgi:steroid 5-alpha reductase family enzyme
VSGGWMSIIGPVTISYIILFVSGVPMTERFMENTPAFADYKRRTSVFIPWFPRRD